MEIHQKRCCNAPFPVDKPPKPHIFQGHAGDFTLINFDGNAFSITAPDTFDYLELTDLREWNNSVFSFLAHVPFHSEHPSYQFTIVAGDKPGKSGTPPFPPSAFDVAARTSCPRVPPSRSPWSMNSARSNSTIGPTIRAHSEDDLKADAAGEQAYYDSLQAADLVDKFGGMPDSGPKLGLQKTGFFHVEKKGDKWMLVDPDGNLFFHLGLCSFQPGDDFTKVAGRKKNYDWLPDYNSAEFKRPLFMAGLAMSLLPLGQHDPQIRQARHFSRLPIDHDRSRAQVGLQFHRRILGCGPRGDPVPRASLT